MNQSWKFALALATLLMGSSVLVQAQSETKPQAQPAASACTLDRSDLQDEMKETQTLVTRMQNRVLTIRNAAGTVENFQLRDALQVNADAWQDLIDSLKQRLDRLQRTIDRCEAREKINAHSK